MHLRLKNFLKHSDFEVTLEEGITVVRGLNNSGKSSLVRAFKVVTGGGRFVDKYIKHHQDYASILFELDGWSGSMNRDAKGLVYEWQGQVVGKVGTSSYGQIFPNFPLKPETVGSSEWVPYVVSQKELPLFGGVNLFEFLSSMFLATNAIQSSLEDVKQNVNGLRAEAKVSNTLKEDAERSLREYENQFDADALKDITHKVTEANRLPQLRREVMGLQSEKEQTVRLVNTMVDVSAATALLDEYATYCKDRKVWDNIGALNILYGNVHNARIDIVDFLHKKEEITPHIQAVVALRLEKQELERDLKSYVVELRELEGSLVCKSCGRPYEGNHNKEIRMNQLKDLESRANKALAQLEERISVESSKTQGYASEADLEREGQALARRMEDLLSQVGGV